MRSVSRLPTIALFLLSLFLPACGSNLSSVSGEVTYDGEPVGKGRISFLPADGKGPSAGGPIAAGKYEVSGLLPGPKLVQITAVKKVPFARSSEEMARRAEEDRARGDNTGLIDPADVIPSDAEGNNVRVELKPGAQTLDFSLRKPGTKAP
jgi:hypothetical protein